MRTIYSSLFYAIGVLGLSATTSGVIFTSFCERVAAPFSGFSGRLCTSGCYEVSTCSDRDSCPPPDSSCVASPNGMGDFQSLRITTCRPGTLDGCSGAGAGASPTPPTPSPTALPTRPEHFTQTSGTCDIPIQSIAECSEAASNLGYAAQAARPDNNTAREASTDPDGCYAERGTLYFGSADGQSWRSSGRCSYTDVCICRSYGYNLPSDDEDDGDYPIGAVVAYIVLFSIGCCMTYKVWMCCIGTPKHPGLVCGRACKVQPAVLQQAQDVAGLDEVAQRNGFSDNSEI